MIRTISSFFDYFAPVYRALPEIKLPGAKKAALIGLACLALYKLYNSFQSLSNRVNELNKELAAAKEAIKTLSKTNKTLSETNEGLNKQLQAKKTRTDDFHPSDKDNNLNDTAEEAYFSAEEEEEKRSNRLEEPTPDPLFPVPAPATPLDLFKTAFPGAHITITHQSSETTLSNYLMKTLFRIEKVTSCVFNQSAGTFTLSYNAPKGVTVTQLPQDIWDSMSWHIKLFVTPLLNIVPEGQLSQKIEGNFVKTNKGTKIELNETSIFLMPNTLGYTGYLKSILIPQIATKQLCIEAEHNASQLDKVGYIDPQLFAKIIYLNFPDEKVE